MNAKATTSLADYVFERLESDIVDGTLEQGTVLTETQLSRQLNVSRTPIREAIRRLEQEMLIYESGKGIVVRGITARDVNDVYEIRLRIEGLATRWCAESITDVQLKHLRNTHDLFHYYTEREIPEQIKDADTQFHELIYEYCESPTLRETLRFLHKKVARFRCLSVKNHDRARIASREHLEILRALEAHDADRAETLAVEHVRAAWNSIKDNHT